MEHLAVTLVVCRMCVFSKISDSAVFQSSPDMDGAKLVLQRSVVGLQPLIDKPLIPPEVKYQILDFENISHCIECNGKVAGNCRLEGGLKVCCHPSDKE
jgi:hypothetical protein